MILGLGLGLVGLLAWLFIVGSLGLTIGIVVLFFVRKQRGEEEPLVTFSAPFMIKAFLYLVTAAAIIVATSGMADLVMARSALACSTSTAAPVPTSKRSWVIFSVSF